MAFQVVDDCFDFSGDPRKVGKTLTTDVERGRMTLPVLRWLAQATDDADRAAREERVLNAREPQAIAAIRSEIAVTGVPSAMETAREYVRAAQAQLAAFPIGSGRDKLHGLAEFIVARDY